jgi:hypothetical protein
MDGASKFSLVLVSFFCTGSQRRARESSIPHWEMSFLELLDSVHVRPHSLFLEVTDKTVTGRDDVRKD